MSVHTCAEIQTQLTRGMSSDEFRAQIHAIPFRLIIGTNIYELVDGNVRITFPDDRTRNIDTWNITKRQR